MEQVGRLVPVNPHTAEVVTEQVVQRVPGQEAQAVRNPVSLIGIVVEIGFRLLAHLANRLRTLFVGARPDAQGNTIKRM